MNASSANGSSGTQGATSAQAGTTASESVASTTSPTAVSTPGGNVIFLNVRRILLAVSIVAVILIVILVIRSILIGHSRNRKRRDIMKRHRSRKDEIIDFDRYTDPFA